MIIQNIFWIGAAVLFWITALLRADHNVRQPIKKKKRKRHGGCPMIGPKVKVLLTDGFLLSFLLLMDYTSNLGTFFLEAAFNPRFVQRRYRPTLERKWKRKSWVTSGKIWLVVRAWR